MSNPRTNLLTVFPGRPNSKIADATEVCTAPRVTRRSSNGPLYTICEYTGKRIAYKTTTDARKRITYSPEPGPKAKMAKQAGPMTRASAAARSPSVRGRHLRSSPIRSPAAPLPPPNTPPPVPPTRVSPPSPSATVQFARAVTPPAFKSPAITPITPVRSYPRPPTPASSGSGRDSVGFPINLSGDEILDFDEAIFDLENLDVEDESLEGNVEAEQREKEEATRGMYSKEDAMPVTLMGKLAVEYDNFDFTSVCEQITSLTCFNKSHEESLLPLLKLVDRDVTSKLSAVNIKNFYKHELIPAMENLKVFKKNPEIFEDKNKGQFEWYREENYIVEVPLPPRPQIFPHQQRKMLLASIAERHSQDMEKRLQEEAKRAKEQEAREAEAAAARRAHYEHLIQEAEEMRRAGMMAQQAANLHPQLPRDQPPIAVPFVNPFVYHDVNNNTNFQHLPNIWFPQHPQAPPPQFPNFFGNPYNHQM